jgi:hypothetical protein
VSEFPDGAAVAGRPFGDEYRRGRASLPVDASTRQGVQRQVDELSQRGADRSLRRRLNVTIQDRWLQRRGSKLAVVTKERGEDAIVVGNELLLARRSWDDPLVRDYVTRRGLHQVAVGCDELESRLVRLQSDPDDPLPLDQLEDTVDELRSRGVPASLNHVTPLGVVMKTSSAIPTPTIGAFTDNTVGTGEGTGARVAVVDTGIDAHIRGDGWLTGIPRTPNDPTTSADEGNIDPLDNDPHDTFLDLSAGHGTFVSGIIAQVAHTADITMYRALSAGGTGSEIEVACKLIRAVKDGAQIVNLSLGTQTQYDQPSLAIAAALEVVREIEVARGEDVLIVASAGNFGDTVPTWPAAFRRIVSVASLTADLRPSAFSSRGWWVDCAAVGEGILSTYVAGTQSTDFSNQPVTFDQDEFARWTGTSFAAPQITGAVARLMQENGVSARRAYVQLLATGVPRPDFGVTFDILPGV